MEQALIESCLINPCEPALQNAIVRSLQTNNTDGERRIRRKEKNILLRHSQDFQA